MGDRFAEMWLVFCYSTKTQLALVLVAIFSIGILLMGQWLVGGFQLTGPLAPLTDTLRDEFIHKYGKVAWSALVGFLLLAAKSYRNDRRRILGM